ncbi:reverse transcriptase [Pyrenophora tritici-repentis]|nr:reverse transcriptase [Pyrenophora tritici-repentis]
MLLADGKAAGIISQYTILPVAMGDHEEHCLFFVTTLSSDTPVIFGLPWLQRHNPSIDWATMSLNFNSWYCLRFCCEHPTLAPVLSDKPTSFHDLGIPGEPPLTNYRVPFCEDSEEESELHEQTQPSRTSNYQYPSCEEEEEEEIQQIQGDYIMHVDKTLTPGRDHYRTRQVGGSHQETQARMIRNYILSRPAPAAIIGGQRMKGQQPRKREALPPLSAPLPHIQEQTGSSDFEDIRMALAPNFIQFCKSPGAEVRRVTWNDLDAAAGPIH